MFRLHTLALVLFLCSWGCGDQQDPFASASHRLQRTQLKRDIALRAQHFMVTPQIVKNSDYVLICSKTFAIKNNLAFQKLPIDLPKVEQHLIWHSSDDNEGPHLWMKDLLIEAFAEAQKV